MAQFDFDNMGGAVDSTGTVYVFPMVVGKDSANRTRQWQIFVRIVKDGARLKAKASSGDSWNPSSETAYKILPEYFKGAMLPAGLVAEYWSETGMQSGVIQRTSPTYVDKITNKGKKNQRNPFQTALINASKRYRDRVQQKKEEKETFATDVDVRYFPMLAEREAQMKHIVYPCCVQPKLDGVRAVMFAAKQNVSPKHSAVLPVDDTTALDDVGVAVSDDIGVNDDAVPPDDTLEDSQVSETKATSDQKSDTLVTIYSRHTKDLAAPSVAEALKGILPRYDLDGHRLYLDGELYKHGVSLQKITGNARTLRASDNGTETLCYYIFDCFYPHAMDMPFSERSKVLDRLFVDIDADPEAAALIKRVPCEIASNAKEMQRIYEKYREEKYEGAILRNLRGKYLGNVREVGTRSKDMVKKKERTTEEFKIVDYTAGAKGKSANSIIWFLETSDGKRFKATYKDLDIAEQQKIYQECLADFAHKYLGKMMTVEYQDLTDDGKPKFAKAIAVRDYE